MARMTNCRVVALRHVTSTGIYVSFPKGSMFPRGEISERPRTHASWLQRCTYPLILSIMADIVTLSVVPPPLSQNWSPPAASGKSISRTPACALPYDYQLTYVFFSCLF